MAPPSQELEPPTNPGRFIPDNYIARTGVDRVRGDRQVPARLCRLKCLEVENVKGRSSHRYHVDPVRVLVRRRHTNPASRRRKRRNLDVETRIGSTGLYRSDCYSRIWVDAL